MTVIDDYIRAAEPDKQPRLQAINETIKTVLPDATEKISWNMPTYWQGHNLIHFAAFKHHIGIYPTPAALNAFSDAVAAYPHTKGAMQIPDGTPLPLALIRQLAHFQLEQELTK
ncbi:iron chaperone [Furfurilactobacillus sp. WILCCON 0119]|uniref:iron chaperone n=1 Tax=Furfurilactobacillus entadae TaxID=2922307 RepID=UPI0035E84269